MVFFNFNFLIDYIFIYFTIWTVTLFFSFSIPFMRVLVQFSADPLLWVNKVFVVEAAENIPKILLSNCSWVGCPSRDKNPDH